MLVVATSLALPLPSPEAGAVVDELVGAIEEEESGLEALLTERAEDVLLDGADPSAGENDAVVGLVAGVVEVSKRRSQDAARGRFGPRGEQGEGALREPSGHSLAAERFLGSSQDLDEKRPSGPGTGGGKVTEQGVPEAGATGGVEEGGAPAEREAS